MHQFDPADIDRILGEHRGQENAIPANELWAKLQNMPSTKDLAIGRKMREMIEEMRRQGYPICSTNHGYFYAKTTQELEDTCRTLYRRAMTGLKQVAGMKKRALPDLAGQLGIEGVEG